MKVIKLEEVDSTNLYAKNSLSTLDDKSIIIAKRQTAGRGRLNRNWVDLGNQNLFMSIVLKPSKQFNELYSNLTQYLSVCLCKVLENEYILTPQIKWPNDVLIENKKIAGILCETVIQGSTFKGIVLGIGVNLNANIDDIKNIPNKVATALNIEVKKEINIEEFTNKLLEEFFNHYEEFLLKGFGYIKSDYIQRNCFLDKELNIQTFNEIKTGIAKSINNSGELILETKEDKNVVLTIGDIL